MARQKNDGRDGSVADRKAHPTNPHHLCVRLFPNIGNTTKKADNSRKTLMHSTRKHER